jgi:GTP-binding protein
MFVDKVTIQVKAGDGGNGAVSFRHEKFVDRGGPDGGDGGNGGDVVLVASRNQNTLAKFRYQKSITAETGAPGTKRRRHGKSASHLLVDIPVGTVVLDAEGGVLADLTDDNQKVVVAKGGQGGFGNAHFISSTRQAPRVAEKGEKGQALEISLELKMIADVGLVGLPNAGKSTLLSIVSNAKPEIANYPFTTVIPNLGVVDIKGRASLLFADIPGLIEGASQGKGLGDEFLRHVERTAVLIHLVDAYNDDVAASYQTIQQELKDYKIDLSTRPQIVVLSKIDGLDKKTVADKLKKLKAVMPARTKLLAISAKTGEGLPELLRSVSTMAKTAHRKTKSTKEEVPVITLTEDLSWKVETTKKGFRVTGRRIERFAQRTDFASSAGVDRLRDIMRKMGIMHELARHGAEPGQQVTIGEPPIGSVEY